MSTSTCNGRFFKKCFLNECFLNSSSCSSDDLRHLQKCEPRPRYLDMDRFRKQLLSFEGELQGDQLGQSVLTRIVAHQHSLHVLSRDLRSAETLRETREATEKRESADILEGEKEKERAAAAADAAAARFFGVEEGPGSGGTATTFFKGEKKRGGKKKTPQDPASGAAEAADFLGTRRSSSSTDAVAETMNIAVAPLLSATAPTPSKDKRLKRGGRNARSGAIDKAGKEPESSQGAASDLPVSRRSSCTTDARPPPPPPPAARQTLVYHDAPPPPAETIAPLLSTIPLDTHHVPLDTHHAGSAGYARLPPADFARQYVVFGLDMLLGELRTKKGFLQSIATMAAGINGGGEY